MSRKRYDKDDFIVRSIHVINYQVLECHDDDCDNENHPWWTQGPWCSCQIGWSSNASVLDPILESIGHGWTLSIGNDYIWGLIAIYEWDETQKQTLPELMVLSRASSMTWSSVIMHDSNGIDGHHRHQNHTHHRSKDE